MFAPPAGLGQRYIASIAGMVPAVAIMAAKSKGFAQVRELYVGDPWAALCIIGAVAAGTLVFVAIAAHTHEKSILQTLLNSLGYTSTFFLGGAAILELIKGL